MVFSLVINNSLLILGLGILIFIADPSQPLPLALDFLNTNDDNQIKQFLDNGQEPIIIPFKVDYHIGSRFDPSKEPSKPGNQQQDDEINNQQIDPAIRTPSIVLPWEEDDPTMMNIHLTAKRQALNPINDNITRSSINFPVVDQQSISNTLNVPTSQSTQLYSPNTLKSISDPSVTSFWLVSNGVSNPTPWEIQDSWKSFQTNLNSSSSSWPGTSSVAISPLITGSSSPSSSAGTTIMYSPLPWEEDYLNLNLPSNTNTTQEQVNNLKPLNPAITNSSGSGVTTPSQETGKQSTTTTTRLTELVTISTKPVEESILFNLSPLKPLIRDSDNWPKFPAKSSNYTAVNSG